MGLDEEPASRGWCGCGQGVVAEVGLCCAAGLRSVPDVVSVHSTSRYCCHFNYQSGLLRHDDCLGEQAADQHELVGVVEPGKIADLAFGTGDEFGHRRGRAHREGDGAVG